MRWAIAYAFEQLFALALFALLFVCVFHVGDGAPTPMSTKSLAGSASTSSCVRSAVAFRALAGGNGRSRVEVGHDPAAAPEDGLNVF